LMICSIAKQKEKKDNAKTPRKDKERRKGKLFCHERGFLGVLSFNLCVIALNV